MQKLSETKRFTQYQELLELHKTQQVLRATKPKDQWHLLRLLELRLKIAGLIQLKRYELKTNQNTN